MYWIDSSLTRNNTYCAEEKRGTSYINEREIELAEYIFDELNQQVGEWKMNHPVEEWANHPIFAMLIVMAPCLSHSSHSMRNKRYTSTQKPSQRLKHNGKTMGTPQHSSGYCRPFQGQKPGCYRKHGSLFTD